MTTYIVKVAKSFETDLDAEEYEIDANSMEDAGRIALGKAGGRAFVASVWAKVPPRYKMQPLELALLERDEARSEALALRYALERLIFRLDHPATTDELEDARRVLTARRI
jgi:hypothetical protein